MLDRIIISKLADGGRLVIPRLGTFFVREDGHIVFSELLRSDDGVLRGLLVSRGVGESEAAGVVDRFVFEIRHTIDHNRPYRIGTLGTLYRDERGIIRFSRDASSGGNASANALRGSSPEMRDLSTAAADRPAARDDDSAAAASADGAERPETGTKDDTSGRKGVNGIKRVVRVLRRRAGADFVLIIAAVTLLAAIGVIVYGYVTANEVRETSLAEMFLGHASDENAEPQEQFPADEEESPAVSDEERGAAQ